MGVWDMREGMDEGSDDGTDEGGRPPPIRGTGYDGGITP